MGSKRRRGREQELAHLEKAAKTSFKREKCQGYSQDTGHWEVSMSGYN